MFVIAGEERGTERKPRGSDSRSLPLQSELELVAIKAPFSAASPGMDAGKGEVTEPRAPQPRKDLGFFLFLSFSKWRHLDDCSGESRTQGVRETEPSGLYLVLGLWGLMGGASGI